METTNEEIILKENKAKFMSTALAVAEEVGEYEVTIKTRNGNISGTIQTKNEFNLQKVNDIAGDLLTTISLCDYGLEIHLWKEL